MKQATFPTDIGGVTPELLTSVLSADRRSVVVEDVRVLHRAKCGDGIASTADRVTLGLSYGPGGDGGLPSQMLLKTLLLHPALRFGWPAILTLSRTGKMLERVPVLGIRARSAVYFMVSQYQKLFPHAPDAMYRIEVRFYRDLRHELTIEAPRAYGMLFDKRTGQFGLLMEDLTLRSAAFPNAATPTTPTTYEEVKNLVGVLAALHARYWESPRFGQDLRWVPTRLQGGMYPVFDAIGLDLIRYQVENHRFKAELIRPLNRSMDQMWQALWETQRFLDAGPHTLLHGDPHIGNTYLLPDGTGGLLDWQLMVRGNWANDLTYLLITGLPTDLRRKYERGLIAHYLDELGRQGVSHPPGAEEAWKRYRIAVIWGLVIGWLITPPQNYGREITEANIARIVAAARDLGSFDLAGRLSA